MPTYGKDQSPKDRLNQLSKSSYLFLLIGGNPLPNLVAAELLSEENAKIVLVHSKGTYEYAEKLQNLLASPQGRNGKPQREKSNIHFLEVEEANPSDISAAISQKIDKILEQKDEEVRFGLNYTGGTKMMAAHAFNEFKKHLADYQPIISYVDARGKAIVIENDGEDPTRVSTDRLIDISLDELIELSGFKYTKKGYGSKKPVYPETALKLAEASACDDGAVAWDEWKQSNVRDNSKTRNNEDWIKVKPGDAIAPWPSRDLQSISDTLKQESGNQADLDFGQLAESATISGKEMLKWFDGTWLESAVLQILLDLKDELDLHDVRTSVELTTDNKLYDKQFKFEIDVTAMRGYQLFAFSCGTDRGQKGGRSRLKHKLFEVNTRAQQIGGDQARAALVCRYEDPKEIEGEVASLLSDEGRIKVFGGPDLANVETLKRDIKEWIEEQC